MAVKNSLAGKPIQRAEITEYMANGMKVTLTPGTVRKYLVSGDPDRVSDQEIAMFINLCRFTGLNPWLREAYCIKYGNDPATLVVGKDAYFKRAEANKDYDGMEAGIIVQNTTGEIEYRVGTMRLKDEELIGGYAEVFRKDRSHSFRVEVSFDEYAGRKRDGTLNSQWSKKPATMIRKVAIVQALREAFPQSFAGMYVAEEAGTSEPDYVAGDIIEPQAQEAIGQSEVLAGKTRIATNTRQDAQDPIDIPEDGADAQEDVEASFFA